jgi:hypothetical protein
VVAFLRFLGVLNASVWFGAIIFFTFAVGPAFFSEAMLQLLGRPHAGAAAQVVLERYFGLQQWCAGLALTHLIAEWLYTGKPFQRLTLLLLMFLFTSGMIGGYVLQPRMKELHLKMYAVQTPQTIKDTSARSFRILHGTSMAMNLIVLLGVSGYLWQVTRPSVNTRFNSVNRFRT